jgi:deazaflavin-dependent oxidoreductase (nitroreductase family)
LHAALSAHKTADRGTVEEGGAALAADDLQGTLLGGEYVPSTLGWVREHVEQVMRTGTTDGVTINGLPTVPMTYRGAKTGKVGKTPVMRVKHEGRYAAVTSKGGEPANPQWYASLLANPAVLLQDGTVTGKYQAREADGQPFSW